MIGNHSRRMIIWIFMLRLHICWLRFMVSRFGLFIDRLWSHII